MNIKTTSIKLVSAAVGAGLALTGVVAVQAPASAEAATVSTVQTASRYQTCKTAKANYTKAKHANAKAKKKAVSVYNKAKKARYKSAKTGTKYTKAASHKKLMKTVNTYYKQSKWKRMSISTSCGSYAKAKKIRTVTNRVKANTKKLNAATTKLSKNVNAYVKKPVKIPSVITKELVVKNTTASKTVTLTYKGGKIEGVVIPSGMKKVHFLSVADRTLAYSWGQYMYAGGPEFFEKYRGSWYFTLEKIGKKGQKITASMINRALQDAKAYKALEVML